jgi:alkylation response protein AidB-like acyl-CoA dehydrogenase
VTNLPFGDIDRELVARASALRPLLAEHATRSESQRQVVPEVMDALETAGLFEVVVPRRVGGLGATMATQLAVAAELGRACPSTAWVQQILNVTTWGAARSKGGTELFERADAGGRPRFAGVIAPSGTARRKGDGYVVSGQWAFASGSFHASWFAGGVLVQDEAGNLVGPGMALLPFSELRIDDTWFVAGMCGTASNTVVADSVVVPSSRVTLLSDEPEEAREPADRWPVGSVLALVLTGSLLGAAQACAEMVIEKAPKRALSYTSYASTTGSMVAVSEVARARLDLDSAWLHAFQAACYIDAVGAGAARDPIEEARLRGQCGYLTALLRRGVDTLINVAGAGSFASASPLQRCWRDLEVGSRHAFLATNVALETYGRGLFGLEPMLAIV